MSGSNLEIYVGALDYFWEWQWRPQPPMPTLPEGVEITFIRIAGEDDRQEAIARWRDQMTAELGDLLTEPLQWDENDRRYVVATPGGKCWTALMLWAAHAEFAEQPPAISGTQDENNKIFYRLDELEALKKPLRFDQILVNIDYWLPAYFDAVHQSTGPDGKGGFIGSSFALLEQLRRLNDQTWKADQKEIQQWSEAGEPSGNLLEGQARYAFAELFIAAQDSCERRMPMKYYFDMSTLEDRDQV